MAMFRPRFLAIAAVLWGLLGSLAGADSPLTSTSFWKAYRDIPEVREAHDIERLNTHLGYYLLSKAPLEHKAAVINALSWNFEGRQNAMLFREILALKYGPGAERRMNAEETFCLGYLTALDDYFHPERARAYLSKARQRLPHSSTVAIVDALVRAQIAFPAASHWGRLWSMTRTALDDSQLTQDKLRPRARQVVRDYMQLYAKYRS